MANITPRKDKGGNIISYRIRVSRGYDINGKQLKPYTKTWKPEKGMTARQIEKELNRQAVQFEEQCKLGYALDTRQTFAAYADYVMKIKEESGTKHRTIERYKGLLDRINAGIGHIKIGDIRPQHLNQFYSQLRKEDIRKCAASAFAKPCLSETCKSSGKLKKDIAAESGIGYTTFSTALRGKRISVETAESISKTLGKPVDKLFDV
ncbi:MAG: site-specific integrase, partial [Oscillospiraceae bacterium]|nr:site-specific integrase [Oscillospiraceae bacterium]